MSNKIPSNLQELYNKFDNCSRCKKEDNHLKHILGGGKFKNPKFFFLFINPTHKNISSHKEYRGDRRYPFIGVRYFWKLFAEAGFISKDIIDNIYNNGWQVDDENKIEEELIRSKVYVSNLVKCTQSHPENPSKDTIKHDLSLLEREIEIVNPEYIIAFGKLPIKIMTGYDIRLKDYLEKVEKKTYKALDSFDEKHKILPCYFPVGRGNPPKALEILKFINKNL